MREKGYDPKACYGSIPNYLRWAVGMKKGSDVSFGIDLGWFFYLHDRHYRNERKKRHTRTRTDFLLKRRTRNKFGNFNKKFLGLYVSTVMWLVLRPCGYFTWVK
jgi:hypothetical protein